MSETDCREILAQIELYLDRELETVRVAEIERHLDDCGECLRRAEFRRSLKVLVSKKCKCDEVPADLRDRVLRRLEREGGRPT